LKFRCVEASNWPGNSNPQAVENTLKKHRGGPGLRNQSDQIQPNPVNSSVARATRPYRPATRRTVRRRRLGPVTTVPVKPRALGRAPNAPARERFRSLSEFGVEL